MLVADGAAEEAKARVVGDERGGGRVRAFDQAGVAKVGELPGSAVEVGDQGAKRAGQFVFGAFGQERGELRKLAAGLTMSVLSCRGQRRSPACSR
jgi:hypothetical protein